MAMSPASCSSAAATSTSPARPAIASEETFEDRTPAASAASTAWVKIPCAASGTGDPVIAVSFADTARAMVATVSPARAAAGEPSVPSTIRPHMARQVTRRSSRPFQHAVLGELVRTHVFEDGRAHLARALRDLEVLDLADELRLDEGRTFDGAQVVDDGCVAHDLAQLRQDGVQHRAGEPRSDLADPPQDPIVVRADQ